jgi:Protein of unknown function (DUF1064)
MRVTEEEYRALLGRKTTPTASTRKRMKYRNKPSLSADGKRFQSKIERDYYEQLLLRWRAGDVKWFVRQPQFDLEGGVIYKADFLVVTKTDDVEVVDTKGMDTRESINKRKQLKERYGIDVLIVRAV